MLALLLITLGDTFKSQPEVSTHNHLDDHQDPEKNRRMGFFHYNEGNKALREGHLKQAIGHYEMALRHDADIIEVYVNQSTTQLRLGQFPEALKTLNQLAEKNPDNPMLHYNLACYHSLTQQPEIALEALEKALSLGFKGKDEIFKDPDLENVRQYSGFRNWTQRQGLERGSN